MEQWAEEYQRLDVPRDMTTAELMLSKHNDLVQHVLDTMFQLVQDGQETSQVRDGEGRRGGGGVCVLVWRRGLASM